MCLVSGLIYFVFKDLARLQKFCSLPQSINETLTYTRGSSTAFGVAEVISSQKKRSGKKLILFSYKSIDN